MKGTAALGQKQIDTMRAQFEEKKRIFESYANTARTFAQVIFGGLTNAIRSGERLEDVLKNIAKQLLALVANRLLMMAFNAILGSFGGAGLGAANAGSGILGSIAANMFGSAVGAASSAAAGGFGAPRIGPTVPVGGQVGLARQGLSAGGPQYNLNVRVDVPTNRIDLDNYIRDNYLPAINRIQQRPRSIV